VGGRAEVAGRRFKAVDADVRNGLNAQVLLRPEELELRPEGYGALLGTVETCSFFGAYFEVLTHAPIGPCRLRLRDPHMPGETLSITWPDRAGIAYSASAN
jgi:ABC-type Fe3+/spermidine/putrescine transport system ATPase subunit